MSNVPVARVVRAAERGTKGSEESGAGSLAVPVQRLWRRVPRSVTWRLLFGGVFAWFGWFTASICMAGVMAAALEGGKGAEHWGMMIAFTGIGLGIALPRLVTGLRERRLLRFGRPVSGTLIRKAEAGYQINDVDVMELTFEYEVDGRRYLTTVKTADPRSLEDDEREPMLYDPLHPSRATPLDHLPGSPRLTAAGELEIRPGYGLQFLCLPVVFIGVSVATLIAGLF